MKIVGAERLLYRRPIYLPCAGVSEKKEEEEQVTYILSSADGRVLLPL